MGQSEADSQTKPPRVIGTAGGSVSHLGSRFGSRAAVGQSGEVRTANVIDPFCQKTGPTVLHDLRLPIAGIDLNIDHIVVSADRVRIIDTKSWKPGVIWTFRGLTRRGLHRFPPAEKSTLEVAVKVIAGYLTSCRVPHKMREPIMVIWSSNRSKRMRIGWYRPRGAEAITGGQLAKRLRGYLGVVSADPEIVRALAELVIRGTGS